MPLCRTYVGDDHRRHFSAYDAEFLFGQSALCSTLIRGGEPFVRPNVGVVNTRTHQRLITFSTASLEPSIRGGLACKLFRAIFFFFSFF